MSSSVVGVSLVSAAGASPPPPAPPQQAGVGVVDETADSPNPIKRPRFDRDDDDDDQLHIEGELSNKHN